MLTTTEYAALLGLSVRVLIVPPNHNNVPGTLIKGGAADTLTIHTTANTQKGANAAMHHTFVASGGGDAQASFTVVVDDHEAILLVPESQVTFHAGDGDGPGNTTSNSMEICENSDGVLATALDNGAKWAAAWCKSHSADVGQLCQHNFWRRTALPHHKDCPFPIRKVPNGWAGWLGQVNAHLKALEGK